MTAPTIAATEVLVTVGIDTHADVHVAVALDQLGRWIDAQSFATTPSGYAQLEQWATTLGTIAAFGVEGTGSWGAGLVRHLRAGGHQVLEVNRADRSARRQHGKSDTLDAEAAARAVLAGTATTQPKTADGNVELIRILMVTRRSAMKARTQTVNQLGALLVTAPAQLREQLRSTPTKQLIDIAAGWRPGAHPHTALQVTKLAMRSLARRYQQLDDEITNLDQHLARLTEQAAPQLIAVKGLGTQTVAALLVAAGDNPTACAASLPSHTSAEQLRSPPHQAKSSVTASTAEVTGKLTGPSTSLPSPAWPGTPPPAPTSTGAPPTAEPRKRSSAASNATSHERSISF